MTLGKQKGMLMRTRRTRRRSLPLLVAIVTALVAVPAVPAVAATPVWHSGPPLSAGRTSTQSVVIGDRAYVLGGYSVDPVSEQLNLHNDVQWAALAPGGGIAGGWHDTTSFAGLRLGEAATAFHDHIYVIGGGDGDVSYFGDVQYATVSPNGDIDRRGWTTSPFRLHFPRAAAGANVATVDGRTYLYVTGGVGADADGNTVHFSNVEYAQIHADGSLGPWVVGPNEFAKPRSAMATAVVDNCLYVVGGFGDLLTDIFTDVQYSCLGQNGAPGAWTTSPNPMRIGRYSPGLVVRPGPYGSARLVVLGGNAGGGTYLSEVEWADVHGHGAISAWHVAPTASFLPRTEWGQTAVLHQGSVFVFGGVTPSQDYVNAVDVARIGRLTAAA